MRYLPLFLFAFLPIILFGQKTEKLDALSREFSKKSFPMLKELLSIPNDAFYPEEIEKNISWCENAFENRGFTLQRLTTETVPLLLAERQHPKAKKTVLIYLQLDGQPVDDTRWFQDSPYSPVLKKKVGEEWQEIPWDNIVEYEDDWRVFARSTSDAKGPVAMFLTALDAIETEKMVPNFNIKVIMDFEEELGSPHLPKAVLDNQEALKADMLIIFDGPRHITNKPTLTFGARGISTITLTIYGAVVAQHGGHFWGYGPNRAL